MSRRNQYFSKFPLTEYNGKPALNILKRVAFNKKVRNFITVFYTHTMPTDEKIVNIAFDYYDDIDYDWLIYHANDIIDPYFQAPLSYEDFDNYIISKYGSIRDAKRKTIHYKNNYEGDEQILSTAAYDALTSDRKKYYQPILSQLGVAGYERGEDDFIVSTNKIETFNLVSSNGSFVDNEVIVRDDDTSTFAEISSANSINLIIRHVRGDFSANTNYTITGEQSGATATVNAESFQLLQNVIPENEQVFYSPVSFFDYESEENEERREIYLVDKSYREKLNDQLTNLMS
jgi:hypothetical protein